MIYTVRQVINSRPKGISFNSYVTIMSLDDIMITKELRMGPNEMKLLFTLEKEEKTVFKIVDAYRILGTSKDSVNTTLYRLRKKGRIEEIERGKYLLIPTRAGIEGSWSEAYYIIVPQLVSPYYIAFWSALNYWEMTEQVPGVTFVATTKRKKNVNFGPTKFEFITLSNKKFFGIVEEKMSGGKFNISSKEKTIVDCLLYPKYCGGLDEVVKGIWESQDELDFEKILDYSKRMGVHVVTRRIGYILDMLKIKNKIIEEIVKSNPKGFMWLDPIGPKKILEYSKKYGLIINRTKKELTGWMGY